MTRGLGLGSDPEGLGLGSDPEGHGAFCIFIVLYLYWYV